MVVTSKREINQWFNQEAGCVRRTTPVAMQPKILDDIEKRRRLALKVLNENGSVTVDDRWNVVE